MNNRTAGLTKQAYASKMKIRDGEEASTDGKCFREETGGERFLQETSGTHLGVLCEEHSVAPAITVREEERIVLR